VQSVNFDVLAVPGVTERGPLGATVVTSYDDYLEKFGNHLLNYRTSVQVQEFFKGGGQRAIINRIMHWDANGNPATGQKAYLMLQSDTGDAVDGIVTGSVAGPFSLADGDTISVDLDRAASPTVATFNAAAASITNYVDGPFALSAGSQITFQFNGNTPVTVTFNAGDFVDIGAATAAEVVAVLNRYFGSQATAAVNGNKIDVTSDQLGTGSSVNLVETGGGLYGADANDDLRFPIATVTGTGDAVNAASVTLAELKTLIEGDVSDCTVSNSGAYLTIATDTSGSAGAVQIMPVSTADTKLGLDNSIHDGVDAGAKNTLRIEALTHGIWGDTLSVKTTAATSGTATEFNLEVYESSTLVETFRNVTMDDTSDTKFVEHVVNTLSSRSKYIRVVDQDAAGGPANQRPANLSSASSLAGGNDGLIGLTTADYTGNSTLATGLHAFSLLRDGDILMCEDDTSTTFQNGAILYCESTKGGKMFYLPQAPAASDSTGAIAQVGALTSSEAASALLWPWVKIPNPDKTIFGQTDSITVSPCGLLAGRMRKNSKENEKQQMWINPGNEVYGLLDNATGLETDEVLNPEIQDKVTDAGINPVVAGIRNADNKYGVWVNDVQAGKTTGNFKSVGENRGVAYLRKAFEGYLEADRTQGNTESRRRRIQKAFEAELLQWTQGENFETTDARTAFYVNADVKGENLNNPVTRDDEQLKVLVGIATGRAARFMTIMFTRDNRAVESYIQQQMASTSTATT
jgi:hypothetical protein